MWSGILEIKRMPNGWPDPDLLEKLCRPFERATGLPLEFRPPGEFRVGGSRATPAFCQVMAQSLRAAERCRQFHLSLQDPAGAIRTARCFAGMTSSAIPVIHNRQVLGYLHTGHASVERPPGCGDPGPSCQLPGRAAAKLPCAGACKTTPVLTRDQYEGAVELAALLAAQLSTMHQPVPGGGEYPVIERFAQEIREDPSRAWTLTYLAKRARMHPSYLSQKFRQRMGMPLTRYLALVRVERAAQLIAYTAQPLGEIAFACGFRSLSQFNRVFKNVTGSTPGEHRRGHRRAQPSAKTDPALKIPPREAVS